MARRTGSGGFVKVGETEVVKAVTKKTTLSKPYLKLIEDAAQIREKPNAAEAAFLARQLVLCTLPHSDPGDVLIFTRRCGAAVNLTLVPYIDRKTGKSIGCPYGVIPRLILFWITTEAVRHGRRLELGNSLAEFMRKVGLDPEHGGVKSDRRRLVKQLERLLRSSISFEVESEDAGLQGRAWEDMQVAPRGELWWDLKDSEQGVLFNSWIELGEGFYKAITACPVPFDLRALRALKRSPLALDLYAWACYTAFAIIAKKDAPQFISWARLHRQFGADYNDLSNFKRKARAALGKVAAVYPGLEIKPEPGGFRLFAQRLAIEKK